MDCLALPLSKKYLVISNISEVIALISRDHPNFT
jgi:hypothetical protein